MRIFPVVIVAVTGLVAAAPGQAADEGKATQGAVIQSIAPPVKQDTAPPPLKLSDTERSRIRAVLATTHTDVDTTQKENAKAKDYEPVAGTKLPEGPVDDALPLELVNEIPVLKSYGYLKLKGKILIVNPMKREVVDVIPES